MLLVGPPCMQGWGQVWVTVLLTLTLPIMANPRGPGLDADWSKLSDGFEEVVPIRVDSSGQELADDLHFRSERRHRRSADVTHIEQTTEEEGAENWTQVRYSLKAFGQQFDLKLTPNADFILPTLRVQHLDVNHTWLVEPAYDSKCFHSASVAGDHASAGAFSVCHSLRGAFQAFDRHYFIEPHPEALNSKNTSKKLHIIYRSKKPLMPAQDSQCGISENYKHGRWKEKEESLGDIFNNIIKSSHESSSSSSNSSSSHHRSKRSWSWQRYVEVMVVADAKMKEYHGNNLQHYVLTLMSIVHSIYKHSTIGNAISVVVVKLLVLESEEAGPKISPNAAVTLREFCLWQQTQNNFDDKSPQHHDTAVLLTRQDICRSASKCDTLGLAELGTICDRYRSCAINEDNGLSAAFTVAHEIGHLFNLRHDNDIKCRPFPEQKSGVYHVMAPTLDYKTHPWSWSACSRKMLTEFLDLGYGECLLDRPPTSEYEMIEDEPGKIFPVDKQCQLVFGEGSKICPYMPACKRLWCQSQVGIANGCQTQHMPWADGTKCDSNKWCQQGECKLQTSQTAVEGQWGMWHSYGECSRTCGGGIKKAIRRCDSPRPANGGKFCIGRRVKYRSCNTAECPVTKQTFREMQCEKFNGRHFNINGLPPTVRWVPKYAGIHEKDRCKLYCRVATSSAYYLLRDKVEDGTKCGPETSDICVNGQCRRAGCDNRLGSKAKRDRCGVCGGDNSSCKTISNTFNHVRYGYNPVVRIPSGATNIDVRQGSQSNKKKDDNYLALKNSKGEFILNGNNIVTAFRKEIKIPGGIIEYSGSDTPIERINSTRMILEDLEVYVLSVGKVYPPDIRYSYIISTQETVNYVWSNKGPWTPCSRICQGFKRRKVVCVREDGGLTIVSDQRCENQEREKPPPILESCNTDCKLKWHFVEQTECSVRCGEGVIQRRIRCQKLDSLAKTDYIDDNHCLKMEPKPEEKIPCRGYCLPTHWKYNEWSQCSKTCGGGVQHREAVCVDINDKPLDSSECNYSTKMIVHACNLEDCPMWKEGEWTGCSVTCGVGVRHRDVRCMKGEQRVSKLLCPRVLEPTSTINCSLSACPQWFNGYWSECSVSCGVGVKTRDVRCMSSNGNLLMETECNAALRPRPEVSCHMPACPTIPPSTTPPTTITIVQKVAVFTNADVTESNALQVTDGREEERNEHLYTRWRTGSWTECSTTCGVGQYERYVSCRDIEGNIADESECIHLPKPVSVDNCKVQSCGQWRTGEWTECSVSCGGGKETRYVACIMMDDLDEQITDHSECDIEVKPTHERLCNRHPCIAQETDVSSISSNRVEGTSHWRVGPWGGCSSTCAGGFQRRRVVCQDENGMSDGCDPSTIPPYIQSCNSGPCPVWNNGEWAACSVTCGGGIQERAVVCQLPSGQTLSAQSCEIMERPSSSRRCATFSCAEHSNVINPVVSESTPVASPYHHNYYRWYRSPWSPYSVSRFFSSGPTTVVAKSNMMCSVTCGKGKKTRTVKCVDEKGQEVNEELCKKLRPKVIRRCRAGKCPRWIAKDWGECSVTCGKGTQHRKVECATKGAAVDPQFCGNQTYPKTEQGCTKQDCLRYNWVPGQWSKCSVTCGDGQKVRRVQCVDSTTGLIVHYKHCDRSSRPKRNKRCSLVACPYAWIVGEWSLCSKTCGEGRQERKVECKAMSREGWILPGETDQCPREKKPTRMQICNLGHCRALYHWHTSGWGRCSARCNQGKKRRRVHCVDVHGGRHSPRNCRSHFKPETSVSCYEKPCYARSCKQFKRMTKIRRDGDYTLIIGGQPLQIYCSRMKKPKPLEFISLVSEDENFSEVFDKRLRNPYTCPGNGSRPKTCDCMNTPYTRWGKSSFSKVRLNITSMRIIANDFKYSRTRGSKRVAYSTAGDCFSAQECPQGRFKMNLSGTKLRVSEATKWGKYGHKASSHIRFSENGQVVYGECGGYCGHCAPLEHLGLQVQVLH